MYDETNQVKNKEPISCPMCSCDCMTSSESDHKIDTKTTENCCD
ncbi:MAG: hypothetical protein ACFFC1_09015 [Promethearchaeota archaeon]